MLRFKTLRKTEETMNHIYFAGYSSIHPADFVFSVPEGYDCCLLLLINTPARFLVDGRITSVPAHHAVFYPPRHEIWYAADGDIYEDDWIRFASDEGFVRNFDLIGQPFPVSDPIYCHNLFQLLTWETIQWLDTDKNSRSAGTDMLPDGGASWDSSLSSGQSSLIISRLLHILFLKLQGDIQSHTPSSHDLELLSLRREIINNPQHDWSVAEMAKQLNMSPGHLHLLYRQKFGISCMDDVIARRIRKAKDQLVHTNRSIAEISGHCGYQNVEHFCRQFRKYVGMTPGSFRKSFRHPS